MNVVKRRNLQQIEAKERSDLSLGILDYSQIVIDNEGKKNVVVLG